MARRILQIDPMPRCNLRCPLCSTGNGTGTRRAPPMTLADFTRLLDEGRAEGFREVHLFNWGESLLHKSIVEMIAACRERGLRPSLHSNLNVPPQRLEEAVAAGLAHITASIDGVSQDAYEAYRRRGRVDLALANLERAAALQDRFDFRVTWQLLVNRFNEHELLAARELALSIGVRFTPLPLGVGEDLPDGAPAAEQLPGLIEEWAARENPYAVRAAYGGRFPEPPLDPSLPCGYLADAVTIHPDLAIGPCCMTVDPASDFGSVKDRSLGEALRDPRFEEALRLFAPDVPAERKPAYGGEGVVCVRCTVYRDHLRALQEPRQPRTRRFTASRRRLEALVADSALAAFLAERGGPAVARRAETAHQALRDTHGRVRAPAALPIAGRLAYCHALVFRNPGFSMCALPPLALLVLGSGALLADGPRSDAEFMAYADGDDAGVQEVYLPALLGVAVAAGLRVDPWCAANVLCGGAHLTTGGPLEEMLDAPDLRRFARSEGRATLPAGEPLFCDLFGRVVAGNARAARRVRAVKLATLRRSPELVLAAAAELARWNLEPPPGARARLDVAAACLRIAHGLDDPAIEATLLDAVVDPCPLLDGPDDVADLLEAATAAEAR